MARQVIGIDFGTSKTSVALLGYGSRYAPTLLEFGGGRKVVPTALLLDPDNQEVLDWGWNAIASRRRADSPVVANFKRQIGQCDISTRYCSLFMQRLAGVIKHQQNSHELSDQHFSTIIGVPANWTDEQKLVTKTIAEEAGFPDVEVESEPIAAMHNLRVQDKAVLRFGDRSEHYMVFDFGGGTLDVCIVRTAELGRKPEIVATDGDPNFGGVDFDELIEGWLLRQCDIDRSSLDVVETAELRARVIEIKHEMSTTFQAGNESSTHTIHLANGEHHFAASRLEFLNRCKAQGYQQRLETVVERVLGKAGMKPNNIRRVIMTGGSCQWHFVGEILAKKMDLGAVGEIIHTVSPDTDVACGLAIRRGRGDEPEHGEGVWVRYLIDEGDPVEKCLFASGRIRREPVRLLLAQVEGTQYFRPNRIQFEFLSGSERENAKTVGDAEVFIHLRSNIPQLQILRNIRDVCKGQATPGLKDAYTIALIARNCDGQYEVEVQDAFGKTKSLRFGQGDSARFKWGGLSSESIREDVALNSIPRRAGPAEKPKARKSRVGARLKSRVSKYRSGQQS